MSYWAVETNKGIWNMKTSDAMSYWASETNKKYVNLWKPVKLWAIAQWRPMKKYIKNLKTSDVMSYCAVETNKIIYKI